MKSQFPKLTKFEINIQPDRNEENDFYTRTVLIPATSLEDIPNEIMIQVAEICLQEMYQFFPDSEPKTTVIIGYICADKSYRERPFLESWITSDGIIHQNQL